MITERNTQFYFYTCITRLWPGIFRGILCSKSAETILD